MPRPVTRTECQWLADHQRCIESWKAWVWVESESNFLSRVWVWFRVLEFFLTRVSLSQKAWVWVKEKYKFESILSQFAKISHTVQKCYVAYFAMHFCILQHIHVMFLQCKGGFNKNKFVTCEPHLLMEIRSS